MDKLGRIYLNEVVFLNCDIQDGFKVITDKVERTVRTAVKLMKFSKELKIPVFVSNQKLLVMGNTYSEIKEYYHEKVVEYEAHPFSKITPEVVKFLKENNIKSVVLYGCQTHVCVLQTCLDLLSRGYIVHLSVDGSMSLVDSENDTAIKRMENSGAIISTSESVMYEIIQSGENPKFKDFLKILKMPKLNLTPKF